MDAADVTPAHLAAETDRVLASAAVLSNDAVLAPSLCAGWSRGHVLTHLARNAEAHAMAALAPEHDHVRVERTPGGRELEVGQVPTLRLRELVFHHVDLDVGYGFEHLRPELTLLLLHDAVERQRRTGLDGPRIELVTDEGEQYVIEAAAPSGGEPLSPDEAQPPRKGSQPASVRVSGTRGALLGWLARGLESDLRADHPLPTLPHGG